MGNPLDLDRVFLAFGINPNLAKKFRDNPSDFREWIIGPLYRIISTGLYPQAQMIDAPAGHNTGMAKVNSALSMLKQATDEEFAVALAEMAKSSTPGFSQMRGESDDLEHAKETILKQRKRIVRLNADLEEMRNFELRLIEHLTLSAVVPPIGPVSKQVHFSKIRNCVIVTADEIYFVTNSGFISCKNWAKRDLDKLSLFLGREATLYSRNFESEEIALSQGTDPTMRIPEVSLFDRRDNQVYKFQIIGSSLDRIVPQSDGIDGIEVDPKDIPQIIRQLDPEVRVDQRLVFLAKIGTGIESIEMVARQRVIERRPGLVLKTTGKVIAIVGPFGLNRNSVTTPFGFEFAYPKKRIAKPRQKVSKKKVEKPIT